MTYHVSVRRKRAHAERAIAFYESRLARIDDRWMGTGSGGERFDTPHHVYADDVDLFGRGSLFELLSAARTRMGEETLARWLQAPADAEAVRVRNACVADLRERLDLREDFALEGASARVGVQPDALLQWARTENRLQGGHILALAFALPALVIVSVIVASVWGTITPVLLVLAAEGFVLYRFRESIQSVIKGTENAFEDLRLLAGLLLRTEREAFTAAPLRKLVERLSSHTLPASKTIARLSTIVGFVEARRNIILALFQLPCSIRCIPRSLPSDGAKLMAPPWRRGSRCWASWRRCSHSPRTPTSIRTIRFPSSSTAQPASKRRHSGTPAAGRSMCSQRCRPLRPDARIARERLQHVREEHAAADGGHQYRARDGRRARSGPVVAADAAPGRARASA